ncbi:UNVERIFIED_CONTAM: hypothetical protein GTU68_030955 [Idotea baltica]|nr:hypothetical protein [Idotea baltica]
MKKIGVLLVNLGTPDSPKTSDVRKYLNEFLTDGRVIDFPWPARQALVRGIITPFRAKNSAASYKEIWDENGSPLLYHSIELSKKVALKLDQATELAMRYQTPSIDAALQKFKDEQVEQIIVFPLFPQYASATTGSVHQKVMKVVSDWWEIPEITLIRDYYDNPDMIQLYADNGRAHGLENFDHFLISFHGLPQRHLRKADHCNHCLKTDNCCDTMNDKNKFCYSAQSYATARALVKNLGLCDDQYTVCFQSRLGKDPWQQPYTSEVLKELAEKGIKKVLCFCPAFVADCLETVFEISDEYQEEFEEEGGEKVQLVESLNSNPRWVETVCSIIRAKA